MRKDVMVDLETIGTTYDSTIIQIAAVTFDIESGEIFDEFNEVADISKNQDIVADGSTLQWWINTNTELFAHLLTSGTHSSEDILHMFHMWLTTRVDDTRDLYLWGNGILFDNAMIRKQFETIGLTYPVFYRNDRDVRTILELASTKLGVTDKELREEVYDKYLEPHDALNDVINQVTLVSHCYRALTKQQGKDE